MFNTFRTFLAWIKTDRLSSGCGFFVLFCFFPVSFKNCFSLLLLWSLGSLNYLLSLKLRQLVHKQVQGHQRSPTQLPWQQLGNSSHTRRISFSEQGVDHVGRKLGRDGISAVFGNIVIRLLMTSYPETLANLAN